MVHSSSSEPVTNITFADNQVHDSRRRGILLMGSSLGTVRFTNNLLQGAGSVGILITRFFQGTAIFEGNTLEETGSSGFVHEEPLPASRVTLDGNTFININNSGGVSEDVIRLGRGGMSSLTITNNTHINEAGYTLQYFIEEHVNAATQAISGNRSPLPSFITP